MLVGDGVESAEIYGCARDTDQARLVFNVAARMVALSPVLSRRLRVIEHSARIVDRKTNSVYAVVPADALGNPGSNPSAVIFDEVLTQPNGDFWTAMRTGMGTRLEPLLIAATTAGNDPTSFAKTEHDEPAQLREAFARRPAWGGLDLASKVDLTAWCLVVPDGIDGHASVLWRFWLPESAVEFLDERTDGKGSRWAEQGWLTVTDGEVIDYDRVEDDITADTGLLRVADISYDE
ncbi:terminase large subunit domain-containing protein [Saccharothrix obliqua]|uniref:terminase large subunit domain-containing protein n=1 Tax=Saccharothrix obliqua TaxID=2861747 RepID=UPI0021506DB2|nr:terminase large subunit [Saccharothrix obliqua]